MDNALETERLRKISGQLEPVENRRYLLLNEMVKQTQDKLDLRSQILAVFMPSRDTTAFLVSNVFHVLARKPYIWAKLRKEIFSFEAQPLTFELLKSMRYLQWVINESTYQARGNFRPKLIQCITHRSPHVLDLR